MGVAKGAFKFLLELKKTTNKVQGKILQLGRQSTYVTFDQIEKISKSFNIKLNPSITPSLSFDPDLKQQGFVDDITFFKSLGFDQVESVDFSTYQNPTFVHDFNHPISENYHEKYDVIFDGGTLEHIFHFPNCLENIHHMLKPGGIIIHFSPSHNHVDHGFYMFSPTVYYDYYSTNKYSILKSNIFEYQVEHFKKNWTIYEYQPGKIDHLSYGGWGNKLLGIWFVAEKTESSTTGVIPQQSFYTTLWNAPSSSPSALKQFIKKHPLLYYWVRFGKRLLNRFTKRKPPIIARY